MKFRITKYGIVGDPRGAQVALTYGGRELLGDVIDARWDQVTGGVRLTVRHFNGELWPIEPIASAVNVLDRTASKGATLLYGLQS